MRSLFPRGPSKVLLCLIAGVALGGCVFTQWTDRYFLGTTGRKPVYEHRVITGAIIIPFALIGDVVTAPLQALILMFAGDNFLYSTRGEGGLEMTSLEPRSSQTGVASRTPEEARWLEEAHAWAQQHPQLSDTTVLGVSTEGNLVVVPVTAEQMLQLRARADSLHAHPTSVQACR